MAPELLVFFFVSYDMSNKTNNNNYNNEKYKISTKITNIGNVNVFIIFSIYKH